MIRVDRARVLAYRIATQQLHRDASSIRDLAVLDIGVQQAMGSPAALAFAARLPAGVDLSPDAVDFGPGTDLAYTWTLRGAPHVHRRGDLDALATALWPLSEQDAAARLNETGPSIERQGIPALEQFATAVRELRAVVTSPTAKGAVSTAVSERIPGVMLRDCRTCKASHISDSAMRAATLPAGLELEPDTSPPVLRRRPKAKVPKRVDRVALAELARAYLRLLGPATVGEFAGYVDARPTDVADVWPDDLVEVDVEGRSAWLPEAGLDALGDAPDPDVVRLLGPFDPYLQARDRDLVVPDKTRHKTLWPTLGRPGSVLANGEIAGAWRTKATKKTLTVTVEPFGRVPKSVWAGVEDEAVRVAQVRGLGDVAVKRAS